MNVSTGDKQEDEILMRMKKGEIDKNLLKDDRLEMVTKECDVKYGQSKRTSNLEELINKYSQYKDAFLDND